MASPIKELINRIPQKIRSSLGTVIKAVLTVLAFWLLLAHQVQMVDHRPVMLTDGTTASLARGDTVMIHNRTAEIVTGKKAVTSDGETLALKTGQAVTISGTDGKLLPLETESTFEAIKNYLPRIEASTFWTFVLLAAFIKFIGILSSMFRWHLLLMGQGIRLPFRHIFGSFLIGRFLGTFLPSTIGLDGYKLYDASRFSRRTVECTAATVIEKVLGIVGIFITFLVALPFGMSILGAQAGKITAITVPIATGIILGFFLLLFYPAIIRWLIEHLPLPGKQKLEGFIHRVSDAASAYRSKKSLLVYAAFMSFLVHFCTAAMYYYTALAIGAAHAEFWEVTFASSIQIFATVISPITIAGEGIREIAQYYLLRNQLGPAESIVSAALGFWAAEALTLFGAYFWWFRKKSYRPKFVYLDGKAADMDTLLSSEDYGLEELRPTSGEPRTKGWARTAFFSRLSAGASGGLLAGGVLGLLESMWTLTTKGATLDIFPYAMLMYGVIGLAAGAGFGFVTGLWALAFGRIKGSAATYALTLSGWFALNLLILGRFLLNRDVFKEQGVPKLALLGLLAAAGISFLILFFWCRSGRRADDPYAVRPMRWTLILFVMAVIIWGIAALTGGHSAPAASGEPIPETLADKPNIILIMCDALRADHLGSYGYPHADTPVLDALAEKNIRFHDAYSQSSWTKPGTANMFTAMYPSGHKTYLKPDILPDDVITLAEVLNDAGYYTVGFPNNINISPSFNFGQGFDEYTYLAPDYFFGAGESTSKLTYYSILRKIREGFLVKSKYPQHYYQEAAVVNAHVADYLDRRGTSDRFFLYLHYMEPHDPFFQHPFNGVGYARVNMPNPDPSWADEFLAAYDQEITYMDSKIGELFDMLKSKGLWDNTIILVTADHGEEFFDHQGWWHGTTLYQELIRIPMIFKLHARAAEIRPPTVRLDRARQIDIPPTLLGLSEIPAPSTMKLGRNLFAHGEDIHRDITVFAEENHEGNVLSAYIEGPWKVIRANPGNPRGLAPEELYRLDLDPLEHDNRARTDPEMLETMNTGLDTAKKTARTGEVERQVKQLSEDEIQKMRELGYIQE